MKRLLAALAALALCASAALAESDERPSMEAQTVVGVSAEASYTITLPASMTLTEDLLPGNFQGRAQIKVSAAPLLERDKPYLNVYWKKGERLGYDFNDFEKDWVDSMNYSLWIDGEQKQVGDVLLSVQSGTPQESVFTLEIETTQEPKYTGTYGTLMRLYVYPAASPDEGYS